MTIEYTYKNLVKDLAKINRDIAISEWKPEYIIGIKRGGLIPAIMLSHYWNVPLHIFEITKEPHIPSQGEFLLVDDINDSGETLKHAKNMIYLYGNTINKMNLKTVTLIDCPQSIFEVDFYGREKNSEEWVKFFWEI